ncbi:MAG: hypothetical protein FWC59_01120 [Actinomycetia bacterium]|nr:hypothetical protein [Actinomycetes bacterium]
MAQTESRSGFSFSQTGQKPNATPAADAKPLDTQLMQSLLQGDRFPVSAEWNGSFIDTDIRDFFDTLFQQTGLKRADVIRRANIDRSYGYQLLDGSRIGKNDYYLSIALAMQLDLTTTNRLLALTKSGGLHPLIKRDAAVIFALNHHYDNDKLYEFLVELGLEPLDTGLI